MSFYFMRDFALQFVFSTLAAVWLMHGGNSSPEMAINPCEYPRVRDRSPVGHSSPLYGNVTMYCEVIFNDNVTSADAVGNWSRRPEDQTWYSKLGNGSFTSHHSSDNTYYMSLSLTNVTESAEALYTFTVKFMNGKCSFQCPNMTLTVEHECYNKEPKPTDRNMTIIHTQFNRPLELTANYTGDADTAHYKIYWWKGDFGDFKIKKSDKYSLEHNKHTVCSFTDKLIIYNLSMADAGLYTAVVAGLHGLGSKTYFQVNIEQTSNKKKKKSNGFFALTIVVPIGIAIVISVSVCIYLYIRRKRGHQQEEGSDDVQELLPLPDIDCRDNSGAEGQGNEQCVNLDSKDDIEQDSVETDGGGGRAIWQTVPGGLLETKELALIANAITPKSDLALHLGLSTAAIEEITLDNKGECQEQKYHMLLRWSKQQSTPNTRQRLVRIIEEEMKKPALAREVTYIIKECFTERE